MGNLYEASDCQTGSRGNSQCGINEEVDMYIYTWTRTQFVACCDDGLELK